MDSLLVFFCSFSSKLPLRDANAEVNNDEIPEVEGIGVGLGSTFRNNF
jgi:hypothetical protein